MRVKKIQLTSYGCMRKRSYEFGNGVNLITGPNGSGKTTICSAVMWGFWGQNTRGVVDDKSDVTLTLEDDRKLHRYLAPQGERVEFTGLSKINKTRFLETINPLVGEYAAWSRSLWITGANVAAFSSGTPSARFQYLAKLVGAERFDKTLERLRDKLKRLKSEAAQIADVEIEDRRIAHEVHGLSEECRELRSYALTAHPPKPSSIEIQTNIDNCKELLAIGEKRVKELNEALAQEVQKTSAVCNTCGSKLVKRSAEYIRIDNELRAASSEMSQQQGAIYAGMNLLAIAKTEERNCNSIAELVDRTTKRYLDKLAQLRTRYAQNQEKRKKLAELETELKLTSQLGVYVKRAKHEYLANAAQHVSTIANEFLASIGSEFEVSVKYSDETLIVSLDRGPVDSYAKLSSGQRRRVDICLCLAMSELAATIGAVPKSAPLVIDEAFDTLDNSGVEALINLACEIARDRQVFLVSHAEPSAPLGPLVHRISL